ncbi:hypothetical protein [Aeromicrobium sp. CTD01-1L150]|uniref:hypothetical protein n=1 Tax=Aeromicrobium sp. CTD01-1L150 TaxID=3341830 RepID=UPI0035C24D6B
MTTVLDLGLDVGSTYVKGQLSDDAGRTLPAVRRPTPWIAVGGSGHGGRTEMSAHALVGTVHEILHDVADQVRTVAADARVRAIGVTGMAESGALLRRQTDRPASGDGRTAAADNVVRPVVAWFDTRGADALATLCADGSGASAPDALDPGAFGPDAFDTAFRRHTGLPFDPLASFAKLLTFRREGLDLNGLEWLNVPELVAHVLGGLRRREPSLAGRTGLIDHETQSAWPATLDALGVGPDLLPPALPAGSVWGHADASVPEPLRGAVLTVAGHDHLVASLAAGVHRPDELYASMGTAEALVRVLEHPLDPEARDRLAARGVDVVPHVLPERAVMLAGTRTGLLLRRVLQLVGVHDADGRAALDDAVMALSAVPDGLSVHGAANDDGALSVRADTDGLSPAALFTATLEHSSAALRDVLAVMDSEVPPARRTVVAGGWAQMRSVRRARARDLPGVTWAHGHEEGAALGAAQLAAFAADTTTRDPAPFLASRLPTTPPPIGGTA